MFVEWVRGWVGTGEEGGAGGFGERGMERKGGGVEDWVVE